MMEKNLKKRGRNFTEFEKSFIIDLVRDFINIIENKKTDAVTVQRKEAAWKEIAIRYNPLSQTGERTPQQLHSLYLTLKKKAKKDNASDRAEICKTGGGITATALDANGKKLLSMMRDQFIPLSKPHDSSAPLYDGIPEDAVREGSEDSEDFIVMKVADDIQDMPQSSTLEEVRNQSAPAKRRKRSHTSSLKELMRHIELRKMLKNNFDQEIHEKKMKIFDLEMKMKQKQLQQAENDCESSRLELEIKKKDLEIKNLQLAAIKQEYL